MTKFTNLKLTPVVIKKEKEKGFCDIIVTWKDDLDQTYKETWILNHPSEEEY